MKHERYINDLDRLDLSEADSLIIAGRSLRKRVMTRLRGRAFRDKGKETHHDRMA